MNKEKIQTAHRNKNKIKNKLRLKQPKNFRNNKPRQNVLVFIKKRVLEVNGERDGNVFYELVSFISHRYGLETHKIRSCDFC